jgi:hypothetical protein
MTGWNRSFDEPISRLSRFGVYCEVMISVLFGN